MSESFTKLNNQYLITYFKFKHALSIKSSALLSLQLLLVPAPPRGFLSCVSFCVWTTNNDSSFHRQFHNHQTPTSCSDTMTINCSFLDVDILMKSFEMAIYIPIFICGLFLNLIALSVFCIFLRKWTETTIYMTSLALMDLLLLFPLPFKMHATHHKWPASFQPFCSVCENLYFVGIYGSIYTIMCIAVDRWVAICHPFKAKQLRSPKAALGICVGVWLLVLAVLSPTVHGFREGEEAEFHCFHGFSKKGWSVPVIICLQVFGFLGPALVVVCCSVQTIWALQLSGQNSPKSRACVKVIYSSLSAFLVPFTPSHLGILLQFLVRETTSKLNSEVKRETS